MEIFEDLKLVAEECSTRKNLCNVERTYAAACEIVNHSKMAPQILFFMQKLKEIQDDMVTYYHSLEVGFLSLHFYRELCLNVEKDIDESTLFIGGLLHDVGKTLTPLPILNKNGALTLDERKIIQHHPLSGKNLLVFNGIKDRDILEMTEYHHENEAGTGYYGIDLNTMSSYVKIVAVADQFSAISQKRPYKEAKTKEETLRIMSENKIDNALLQVIG